MNTNPDQWQIESCIKFNWEYLGFGWFTQDDMFGCYISEHFFLAYHDETLH